MSWDDPAGAGPEGFVLYLEGPGDRAIVDGWCRRLLPAAATALSRSTVLLGGKQPVRAVEHFRRLGGAESGLRALCVLDRDDEAGGTAPPEPGIEFFTWRRRHIESYLLVPSAIRRTLGRGRAGPRVDRALRDHIPAPAEEDAYRELDAKWLLSPGGPLSRTLGRPLSLSRVARATRESELHDDVHDCFARVKRGMGIVDAVVVR